MPLVSDFLKEIDRRWIATQESKIVLRIIGSSALMLQTGYERGTKDSDVLETVSLTGDIKRRLLGLAGTGTDLLPRYVRNLNRVERDYLVVDETTIDLPEWIG